jgi:hypothetical protein
MAVLTRDQILQAVDLGRELVSVPEWGGEVYVRVMTLGERLRWEDAPTGDASVLLLAMTLCDDKGELLFTAADLEALRKKSIAATMRLLRVARRLNGLSKEDLEAVQKKSETPPSSSGS